MTYVSCKTVITNRTYTSKEEMQTKLDVFYLNNRLSETQYNELTQMLANQI